MAKALHPRVIAITGASSGLGRALSACYAAPGHCLLLIGRNKERLQDVANDAVRKGATAETAVVDVRDADAIATCITAFDTHTPIDLLIANAGVAGAEFAPPVRTQSVFAINALGVFNTVEPMLHRMQERRAGQIAIVSSLAGYRGLPGSVAYCSSKAAVKAYGEGLRGRCREDGVAVNVITPGFVKTPLTDRNRFPMPFLWPADRAALHIKAKLARNQGRIAFPWPMFVFTRMLQIIPDAWATALTARGPRKA